MADRSMRSRKAVAICAGLLLILFLPMLGLLLAWSTWPPAPAVVIIPPIKTAPGTPQLIPAAFSDLQGWRLDQQGAALAAFKKSCAAFARRPDRRLLSPANGIGGRMADWRAVCVAAKSTPAGDPAARAFLEKHFQPYQLAAPAAVKGDVNSLRGLFTGYYEPSLRGSRRRHGAYKIPLLGPPSDLVTVNLGEFNQRYKGKRIVGRVVAGRLRPYADRAAIATKGLGKKSRVIVYLDDAVDAFFLHIQGSGRVALADGGKMRVGYAAANGRPYVAIGRELIRRGALTRQNVSLQSIRAWLVAHPDDAAAVMNKNPSYVFFHERKGPGPLGALGVALSPGRSLAVDRRLLPLGVPIWLETMVPAVKGAAGDGNGDLKSVPWRRLMMAQDTGGAIRGAVRGDIFFGHGAGAEWQAGHMKAQGRYFILLPKNLPVTKQR